MQPSATEVEREARGVDDRPGAAAKPRTRLDDEAVDFRFVQPACGGDAGRSAADHHHIDIATRHDDLAP